jgi:indolepyruvate decarboxylase
MAQGPSISSNSIAGAYAERSPVVVIAGAPGAHERTSCFLLHHQARTVDTQLVVFKEITCDQAVLADPVTAPAQIARVLRCAREMSLPVYLEFLRDMVAAKVEPVVALPPRDADASALAECADEILERIEAAAAPVVVVDVEIRRYGVEDKIAALARKLNLPLVTTFMGRGLLEHAPDVVAGTYLGAAGDPAITRLVKDADLVLMLGVILSDTNFALSNRAPDPRRTILASSREVQIGYHCFRDMPLAEPIEGLDARAKPSAPRPHQLKQRSLYPRGLPTDDAPISPSDIATAINDLFDRHGKMPMTSDIGDCLYTAMEIDNRALAAPGYYAGMGFGVPAGIGVAATGLRPLPKPDSTQMRPPCISSSVPQASFSRWRGWRTAGAFH